MKVTAVIPVRKGSERVPNKSLRSFGDTNLLIKKIIELKAVSLIEEIIVNTDSDEALDIARSFGVSGHKRDAYYASSSCSNSDFLEHLGVVTNTDIFAYCPCTTPFITAKTITECIELFLNHPQECDSVASVSPVKEFMWLNGSPINYERDKQPNSQNLPEIVSLNFGINLISRNDLILYKNIVGLKPIFKITSEVESIDIDTPLDFFVAEQLYLSDFANNTLLAAD